MADSSEDPGAPDSGGHVARDDGPGFWTDQRMRDAVPQPMPTVVHDGMPPAPPQEDDQLGTGVIAVLPGEAVDQGDDPPRGW